MVPSPRRMLARTYELLAFALPDKWHHRLLVCALALTQAPGALCASERVRTLGKGAYGLVVLGKDVQTGEQVSPVMYAIVPHVPGSQDTLRLCPACHTRLA